MHFQHLFPTKVYNQWSPTGGPQPKYSPLNCPIRPRTGWQNYHLFAGLEPQVSVQVFWPPVGYSWWRRLIRKKKDILVKKKICFFFWCDNFVFTLSAESDFFFFLPVRLWWHKVKVSVSSDLRTFSDTAETEGNRTIIMEWILPLENLSLTE